MLYLKITILGLTFAEAARKRFVWLTDTHSDPFYGTDAQAPGAKPPSVTEANTWGTMGNDPGYEMLQSAVTAAADFANDTGWCVSMRCDVKTYDEFLIPLNLCWQHSYSTRVTSCVIIRITWKALGKM